MVDIESSCCHKFKNIYSELEDVLWAENGMSEDHLSLLCVASTIYKVGVVVSYRCGVADNRQLHSCLYQVAVNAL